MKERGQHSGGLPELSSWRPLCDLSSVGKVGEGCLECLLGELSERKLVCQGWERWGRGVWNVYWVHCLKGNLVA